jgi:hypothetical protein
MSKKEKLDKIYFDLEEDWHGHKTESLWAERLDNGSFRLRNVPFYAKGVSCEDIIEVKKVDNLNIFNKVIKGGGHSTYRIIRHPKTSDEDFIKYWTSLEKIGCTYEKGEGRLYAVDVPETTNIYDCYSLLTLGEKEDVWDFEEGHCGHSTNKS